MIIKFAILAFLLIFFTDGRAAQETESTVPDNAAEGAATVKPDGEEEEEEEKDPNRGRFLALPFIITEPAIGEGLGAGLVYFHRKPDEDEQRKVTSARNLQNTGKRGKPPAEATGLFAMYTNTETYAYGIGHAGHTPTDKYRYVGVAAGLEVRSTYYENDIPINFTLNGTVLYLHGKRRWGETNVFIGASMSYLDSTTNFKFEGGSIDPTVFDFESTDIGMALSGIYDTRDDSMMPNTGQLYDLTVWEYGDFIGGDLNYTTAEFKFNTFYEMAEKFVLGFRFEASTASGDIPYYAEPFVALRGIPALRYTGESVGVFEVEGRYDFAKRWSVVAFAGFGMVDETDFSQTEDDINTYGAGVRFQVLKAQNFWLGFDVAQGPEESAWYIQMGHPW
jgi:outer membrane protein assembly factor BamA